MTAYFLLRKVIFENREQELSIGIEIVSVTCAIASQLTL
jgi:hypothetical protein